MVQLRSYRRGVVASGSRGVRSRRSSALRGACPADLLSSGAGSGEQGQAQRDLRSPTQATHGLDAPSVRLDDGLGYRQAEPGASQPARTRLLKAVEALEDARQLFSGYSRAAILHADMQLAGADERGEGNRTPGRAVLGGVVYQYKHSLLYPLGIYLDESSAFQLSFQLGAVLASENLGPSRELRQIECGGDRLERERGGGRVGPGEEQQVLDHPRHPLGLRYYFLEEPRVVRVSAQRQPDLSVATQHGQWRPQLVGDVGDEVRFGFVGPGELIRGLLLLGVEPPQLVDD